MVREKVCFKDDDDMLNFVRENVPPTEVYDFDYLVKHIVKITTPVAYIVSLTRQMKEYERYEIIKEMLEEGYIDKNKLAIELGYKLVGDGKISEEGIKSEDIKVNDDGELEDKNFSDVFNNEDDDMFVSKNSNSVSAYVDIDELDDDW